MKRTCPYCENKIKGKRLTSHILEHKNEIQEEHDEHTFKCYENCKQVCCKDTDLLASLTAGDIIRISKFLSIDVLTFFYKYCHVRLVGIIDRKIFTGAYLNRPCQFHAHENCLIYKARPLSCRTFPEKFKMESTPRGEDFDSYKEEGYKCIENDFELSDIEKKRLGVLSKIMSCEIEKTNNYMGILNVDEHKELISFIKEFIEERSPVMRYTPNGRPMHDAKYFSEINKKLWELKKEYYVNKIKTLGVEDYRNEYDILNY